MNFTRTCTVLLAVFVIHSAYGFDVVLKDKDCDGNDLTIIKKSLVDCMKLCNKDTKCIGIVHDGKKRCWTKSKCDVNDRKYNDQRSIYLKPRGGFNFKKRLTCPGHDVVIFSQKMSITDCMIKCNKNRACIAVTYNHGNCTGKFQCLATTRTKGANTYFRPEDSIREIPQFNCEGGDICNKGNISLQLCLELCGSFPHCEGIVYSNNTSCFLKWTCETVGFHDRYSTGYELSRRRDFHTCRSNCVCDHNCLVKNRKLECSCDEGFALSTNDSRSCIKCHEKLDVVFLLDGSKSVKNNFKKQQQFVKDMIDSFIIGENDVLVGLVVFSTKATHQFFLNSHTSKAAMKSAVDSINIPWKKTNMHIGLEFVEAQFNATNGQRSAVPNVLIALSDGKFEDRPVARFRAQELKDAGAVIYSVGIANVDVAEIKEIASPPRKLHYNYFITSDFIGLVEEVKHSLLEKVCTESEKLYNEAKIKECGCQHNCELINGTQTCFCNEGFALDDDHKSCRGCLKPLDVVFLLDSSSSISSDAWTKEKLFVSKIVESLIVNKNQVNVGLVGFATFAKHFFFLNTFLNKTELQTAINNVEFFGGGTDLTEGLEFVQDQFIATNGARSKVPNVLVILTDGNADNPRNANAKAQELKDAGITIYSVGVGSIVATEIKELSSPPQKEHENFFITKDFDTLVEEVKDVLLGNICQA